MTGTLFDRFVSHCFWGWCDHQEAALTPDAAHASMEAHYATAHAADMDKLGYPTT